MPEKALCLVIRIDYSLSEIIGPDVVRIEISR
jgi:hypothetical protein